MIPLDMTNKLRFPHRRSNSRMRTEGMRTLALSSVLKDTLCMLRRRLRSDNHLHMECMLSRQMPSKCQQGMRNKCRNFRTFQRGMELYE